MPAHVSACPSCGHRPLLRHCDLPSVKGPRSSATCDLVRCTNRDCRAYGKPPGPDGRAARLWVVPPAEQAHREAA